MRDDGGIQNRLINVFKQKLEIDVPSVDTDLMETGLMDSLIFVELLFHIENEFGIAITMDTLELEYFRSVGTIVTFIEQRDGTVRSDFGKAFTPEAQEAQTLPLPGERMLGDTISPLQ
jgi:acyl carrier protein